MLWFFRWLRYLAWYGYVVCPRPNRIFNVPDLNVSLHTAWAGLSLFFVTGGWNFNKFGLSGVRPRLLFSSVVMLPSTSKYFLLLCNSFQTFGWFYLFGILILTLGGDAPSVVGCVFDPLLLQRATCFCLFFLPLPNLYTCIPFMHSTYWKYSNRWEDGVPQLVLTLHYTYCTSVRRPQWLGVPVVPGTSPRRPPVLFYS